MCIPLKTFPWFLNGKGVFIAKWKKLGISAMPNFALPIPGDPITWSPVLSYHLILAIAGGIIVGSVSVVAGGCPFRQHVMAAEGNKSALFYVFGFILGAILFHKVVAPIIKSLL